MRPALLRRLDLYAVRPLRLVFGFVRSRCIGVFVFEAFLSAFAAGSFVSFIFFIFIERAL
jgi:hypothetical protein